MTARQKTLALLTVVIALVLEIVDFTIVNTALPSIRRDFGGGGDVTQWIVAGYSLSFALLLMAGGRLGDSFGYRPIYVVGVAGFTLSSLACGLAANGQQLIVARLCQGATGALMAPQALALVQVLFTPRERVSKMAVFGLVGGIASISGPILGGLLIAATLFGLGWRMIFLINLPVGIVATAAGWLLLPHARSARPAGFDTAGMLLFGGAVAAALWPLSRVSAGLHWPEAAALFAAIPLAVAGWRHVGTRVAAHRAALFDPALFAIPCFRLGIAISVIFAVANGGFLLIFAFALQTERGLSPLTAGLLHIPFGLGVMFGIVVLGRNLLPGMGRWLLVCGALIMAVAGAGVLTGVGAPGLSFAALIPMIALAGTGMGLMAGGTGPVTLAQVDPDHAGASSGLLKTCQELGSAIGVACVGGVYFAWGRSRGLPPSQPAMWLIVVLLMLCALIALRLPRDIFGHDPHHLPEGTVDNA